MGKKKGGVDNFWLEIKAGRMQKHKNIQIVAHTSLSLWVYLSDHTMAGRGMVFSVFVF